MPNSDVTHDPKAESKLHSLYQLLISIVERTCFHPINRRAIIIKENEQKSFVHFDARQNEAQRSYKPFSLSHSCGRE